MYMRGLAAVVAALVLVLLPAAAAAAGGVYDGSGDGNYYRSNHEPMRMPSENWTYDNVSNWPTQCQQGMRQSPVNFANLDVSEVDTSAALSRLRFSPGCVFAAEQTDMQVRNTMNTITVTFIDPRQDANTPSPCTVTDPLRPGIEYTLHSINFHVPPEHLFRSVRPDAEMQLFFEASGKTLQTSPGLTIAVFLRASGRANSTSVRALRHMIIDGRLPPPQAMTTCTLTEPLDLTSLLPARESYLLYNGSLPYPPCTERVHWVVMTSPIFISRLALGKLREALAEAMPNTFDRLGNARPPQALNSRKVYRFVDEDKNDKKKQQQQHGGGGDNDNGDGNAPRDAWGGHEVQRSIAASNKASGSAAAGDDDDSSATDNGDALHASVDLYDDNSYSTTRNGAEHKTSKAGATSEAKQSSTTATRRGAATAQPPPPQPLPDNDDTSDAAKKVKATTTTTTTRAPKHKSSKKAAKQGKNNSDEDDMDSSDSASVSRMTQMWHRMRHAAKTAVDYARAHPILLAGAVLCMLLALYLFVAACMACRSPPAYMAGVDPQLLQPLRTTRPYEYGTGAP